MELGRRTRLGRTARRAALAGALLAGTLLGGCSSDARKTEKPADREKPAARLADTPAPDDFTKKQVRIKTRHGDMVVRLFPDKAPGTVKNFCTLAQKGFYDGLIFHRVIKGFMIQGGDPKGTGEGGPGYTIKAEFNDRSHTRGRLSMARTPDPDSAGSQFFIVHQDSTHLDKQYTVFGELVSGLDVLDKIAEAPVDDERPKDPVKMDKVIVEDAR